MSVEFAQKTELARINKQSFQTSTSMQTQSDEKEQEETPRASLSGGWLEDSERERLEQELQQRDAEIQKLKGELQKTETVLKQVSVGKLPHTSTTF